jgi:hypothetical protein
VTTRQVQDSQTIGAKYSIQQSETLTLPISTIAITESELKDDGYIPQLQETPATFNHITQIDAASSTVAYSEIEPKTTRPSKFDNVLYNAQFEDLLKSSLTSVKQSPVNSTSVKTDASTAQLHAARGYSASDTDVQAESTLMGHDVKVEEKTENETRDENLEDKKRQEDLDYFEQKKKDVLERRKKRQQRFTGLSQTEMPTAVEEPVRASAPILPTKSSISRDDVNHLYQSMPAFTSSKIQEEVRNDFVLLKLKCICDDNETFRLTKKVLNYFKHPNWKIAMKYSGDVI